MLKIVVVSLMLLSALQLPANEEHGHGEHEDKEQHHDDEEKDSGFKLTPASIKTFELKTLKYEGVKTSISKAAIYKGLNEVNVYRLRAGLFKRIDFKIISETKNDFLISSLDLSVGDEVVVNGVGFLRIAEIAASGGLESSHSH